MICWQMDREAGERPSLAQTGRCPVSWRGNELGDKSSRPLKRGGWNSSAPRGVDWSFDVQHKGSVWWWMSSGRKADSAVCCKAGLAAERDEGGTKTRKKRSRHFLECFFLFILPDRYKKLHGHTRTHTYIHTEDICSEHEDKAADESLHCYHTPGAESYFEVHFCRSQATHVSRSMLLFQQWSRKGWKIYTTYFKQHSAASPLLAPVIRKHLRNIDWFFFPFVF